MLFMNNLGLVSIITPTYNCDRFIAETIRSVQAQTYTEWEMIIVDDCSTDNTQQVLKPFLETDCRIHYLRNEENSGAAISRNRALSKAKGKWIAFVDSDDLWLPDKLERQVAFMEENGYHFSYHEYDEIDEDSKPLGIHVGGKKRVSRFDMFACCWPGCLSVMYDSEYVGLIQIEDVRKNNDTAIWLEVVKKTPCFLLNENLALYRRRRGSITPVSIWGKIKAHYPLFRIAQRQNPVFAWFWTFMNVPGNIFKKIFYVKRYSVQ